MFGPTEISRLTVKLRAAAAGGFVLFLLSLAAVQGQNGWRVSYSRVSICAVEGSTMEISCTFTYPAVVNGLSTTVERAFWFTKLKDGEPFDLRADSEYAGRVQFHCEGDRCTLKITDLRESDSAMYKFRFMTNQPSGSYSGERGVSLSVAGFQVQLKKKSSGCMIGSCTKNNYRCFSRCYLPGLSPYIWYKNGENLKKSDSSLSTTSYSADGYSCAAEKYEDTPSPQVCGHGHSCHRVMYTDRKICAFKGSSVNISCTYNSNGGTTSKFWFSPNHAHHWWYHLRPEDLINDFHYADRVQVFETNTGLSTLRISDLRDSDSAEYRFKFRTRDFEWKSQLPGTTLTVKDPDLQVQVVWSSTGPKLICHSSCILGGRSPFFWFKNETRVMEEKSSSYRGNVDSAYLYSCAYMGFRSMPVYAPTTPLMLMSSSGDILKGSSVTLTCSTDANPAPKYTWFKGNQSLLSEEPHMNLNSIQLSDSGEYYCMAENELGRRKSKHMLVDVKYGPESVTLSVSPSANIAEGSSVNLTCSSDANPSATYTWYKENLTLLQGPASIYSFPSISSDDIGTYFCTSKNGFGHVKSSPQFLDVQYAPKLPSVSVSPSAEIVEGSSVNLTCSSDANPAATYMWYKENEDAPRASGQTFTMTDVRAEHSGNYYCEARNMRGSHKSSSQLLVLALIQGQNDWSVTYPKTQICALKGSTVDIPCTYTYPSVINCQTTEVQSRWWCTKESCCKPMELRSDSGYSDPSGYYFHENDCTLRINNLRESDSAEYKFMFTTNQPWGIYTGEPGVTLTVTDLQVEVIRFSYNQAELRCTSSCSVADNPSYVWYINGHKMDEETSTLTVSVNNNKYSCTVKGQDKYGSPAVYAPALPSVSVSPSAEIVEGNDVTLTCSSDANPAATYTWYKTNVHQPQTKGAQLVFRNIQPSDSGEFYCDAENQLGRRRSHSISINVKYAPKSCSVSVNPTGEIRENSSVTLTCSSDGYPEPEYTWYKEGGHGHLRKGSELVFRSIQSSDSGYYYCRASNGQGTVRTSRSTSIDVKYAPKLPSVSVSPSGEIVEGDYVTLTCSSDANPAAAKHSWYKKTGHRGTLVSSRTTLYFWPIKASDSGEYYCTAENRLGSRVSESSVIDVKYAPKMKQISVSPSAEIVEGNDVTLTCSSDANPAATYTWYKKTRYQPYGYPRKGPQLVLRSIQSSDSGQYYCEAENNQGTRTSQLVSIDVKYPPKLPSVSVSPSAEIVEGNDVTLTCSSDANPAANYTWYKKNENPDPQPTGEGLQLLFEPIKSHDFGQYYCRAENKLGKRTSKYITVDVKYPPNLPNITVSPSAEIVEGSSVTLTCSSDANPAANFTWFKEHEDSPTASGQIFTINNTRPEHSGNYVCLAQNERGRHNSTVHLTVEEDAPKLQPVSVSPSAEIVEGNDVTLTCSSDANPAATYTWYKTNVHQPLTKGAQLVFRNIQPSDSGEFYCEAENQLGRRRSRRISINVKYAPKLQPVSVSPSGEIVEGNYVTLTCSSDANPAAAKHSWYKKTGNRGTLVSSRTTLNFWSIKASDSGEYYCSAENRLGSRASESSVIDVKYAPKMKQISVSPSAEIVEGNHVTLTCSSDANPAPTYTWYKTNVHQPQTKGAQLVFRNIQPSDSGEFYCDAENQLGTKRSRRISINVKYAPKSCSVSVNPTGEITENSSVTLTCSSDGYPEPEYTWYKEGGHGHLRKGSELVFRSIQSSDSGNYYCRASNGQGTGRTSRSISIDVKYAPKLRHVSVSPSGEIVEGNYVTLTCSSDANPAAKHNWYKKTGNRGTFVRSSITLYFWSIKASDSGEYYCSAENRLGSRVSESSVIDVKYAPKMKQISVSPSAEIVEGNHVTLTCSSDANPAATYTWYKKTRYQTYGYPRKGPQLVLRSIQSSDSGQYYCEAKNNQGTRTSQLVSIDVKYPPKLPSVSVSPSAEIVEGNDVILTCSSDANPAANYTWYKKNENPDPQPQGEGPQLLFKRIQSPDLGQYYCRAENKLEKRTSEYITVNVKYAPNLPNITVSPSAEIVEGSSVTLTCSSDANPAANFTWFKEHEDSPTASGQIFTINNTRFEHSGNYVCLARNEKGHHNSTVHLTVEEGAWRRVTAAVVPALMLALILVFVVSWFIKKRTCKKQSEPRERPDSGAQIQMAEMQDDLQYATIHFPKNQEDHVYANVKPAKPKRKKKATNAEVKEDEEETTEYSTVRFNGASSAQSGQESVEDPAALYSKVNKPPKTHIHRNL
ncbi:sialoadhesin-like [Xyrichtys novacula]|uniref:Sialoadhesin-like n=1 Tax=Xyrichtys novacula TaxID=13765 RepID=A0AAV1EW30_XYRNO|nr:sialoadhesin-like [Xyrichtys novacula]